MTAPGSGFRAQIDTLLKCVAPILLTFFVGYRRVSGFTLLHNNWCKHCSNLPLGMLEDDDVFDRSCGHTIHTLCMVYLYKTRQFCARIKPVQYRYCYRPWRIEVTNFVSLLFHVSATEFLLLMKLQIYKITCYQKTKLNPLKDESASH